MKAFAQLAPLPPNDGVAGWEIAIALGLILLVIIVALAKSVDVWRRRRRDRAHLRGTVTDALMRGERLAGLMLVRRAVQREDYRVVAELVGKKRHRETVAKWGSRSAKGPEAHV